MSHKYFKKNRIVILAVIIGVLVVVFYLFSGQSGLDANSRELQNSDEKVEGINVVSSETGEKTLEVECKDGSSYEVYYPPGETEYDGIASSKCQ
jgi:coenzyme F420-reducing hydrogenase beta subunit